MSEVRPIDANALKEWIDESVRLYSNQYSTDMLNMFGLFKEAIDNAPTVEPEITIEDIQNAIKQGYNDSYKITKAKFERSKGYCDTCIHNGGYPSKETCVNCKDFDAYERR